MNDKQRLLVMLPILGIAGWLAFFADKTPVDESGVAPRVTPVAVVTQGSQQATGAVVAVASAPLADTNATPRSAIALALKEASPANLFVSTAPPAPPPAADAFDEDNPPPPPPPSFVVIGSVIKDGRLNVFLDKDNQTYVAAPGAVIDGNRVDVVKSDQVQLFNLSTKTTQIIPIEGDK